MSLYLLCKSVYFCVKVCGMSNSNSLTLIIPIWIETIPRTALIVIWLHTISPKYALWHAIVLSLSLSLFIVFGITAGYIIIAIGKWMSHLWTKCDTCVCVWWNYTSKFSHLYKYMTYMGNSPNVNQLNKYLYIYIYICYTDSVLLNVNFAFAEQK